MSMYNLYLALIYENKQRSGVRIFKSLDKFRRFSLKIMDKFYHFSLLKSRGVMHLKVSLLIGQTPEDFDNMVKEAL